MYYCVFISYNYRIEWEAYDVHSGLDSVYWKLYDNFGGTVILHGHEDIIAQGNSQVWYHHTVSLS